MVLEMKYMVTHAIVKCSNDDILFAKHTLVQNDLNYPFELSL